MLRIPTLLTMFFFSNISDNTEDGKSKSLASFDISCDDKFLAAGTEQTGGDAFITFWDIRYTKKNMKNKSKKRHFKNYPIGGYWESHTDDITCLTFHFVNPSILASGSTDGLINVFDLTQPSEEAALTYTLNTESSVVRKLSRTCLLHKLTERVLINCL